MKKDQKDQQPDQLQEKTQQKAAKQHSKELLMRTAPTAVGMAEGVVWILDGEGGGLDLG
jgi:hypothetical protein